MDAGETSAVAKAAKPAHPVPKPAGRKRHWLRGLLLLLVVIVVGGAAGGYWFLFGRVHRLDVYRQAMETIEKSKDLQSELGQPIHAVAWPLPAARIEESETDVRWDIRARTRGRKDGLTRTFTPG